MSRTVKTVGWWRVLPGLCFLALAQTGCDRADPPPAAKVVVVFVDVSGSIRDYSAYRRDWPIILSHLKGGDRIVLGLISDVTYTRFQPVIDLEIPSFDSLSDNKLLYEQRLTQFQQQLANALDKALAALRSRKTDILNTLNLAEQIFAGDRRKHVLVILSDMLEDSDEYNFEKANLTESFTKHAIEKRQRAGLVPNLNGAMIYVAGASAPTAGKAYQVKRFWQEYVRATHGFLLDGNYGPALMHFEP